MKIKKYALFVLILIMLFGVLSPVSASIIDENEPCNSTNTNQPCQSVSSGFGGFLATIQGLLNSVVPVLISLGIVYLVWGIVQYMIGDSEEAKTKGKERVIFGLVGLAIIISVWGLVSIITKTFNLQGSAPTKTELQNLLPR